MAVREWHEELASTQDRALALARAGAQEGTRVVAARQTAGRGRLDHRWHSPAGGLYLSVVLAAPDPASPLLPLAIADRVAGVWGPRAELPLAIKWPNDLLVAPDGLPARKLAGILVDRVASPTLGGAAVAGIGVNVVRPAEPSPPELARSTAYLEELVRPVPALPEVEEAVAEAAVRAARSLAGADGRASTVRSVRARLYGVGRTAEIDGRARGTIVGVGDDGELWIADGGDRLSIRAGDLRVGGPA